jgi:hypothetical protein
MLTKEELEKKFEEKSKELQSMQKDYDTLGNMIKEGIGELKAYQRLFQEHYLDSDEKEESSEE